MWIYLTDNDGLPSIILYEYQSGRNGDYAKNFLDGFSGLLECDGYTGQRGKCDSGLLPRTLPAVFFRSHPGRPPQKMKLLDINSPEEIPEEAADPEKAKEVKKIPAEIGLCYCNKLFRVERTLKDLSPEERKAKRLELEVPIWDSFCSWLESIKPLGGSLLEKAVNYAVNHLNVFQYLYTLLLYMPDYNQEPAGVESMMPWSDFIKERCSGVMDTETETPENRGKLPL